MQRISFLLSFILLNLLPIFSSVAQSTNDNCINAQNLCPNTTFTSTTFAAGTEICGGCADAAIQTGNFCFAINRTIWFSFITNSIGGNADVLISNISCFIGVGFDTDLQAVVIQAGTPCNETTYSAVSNCETGTGNDFTLNATGLLPNTTYYVQVNGDLTGIGITNSAECDFNIEVSGAAVDPTIVTSTTPSECGLDDGTFLVNSVNGGQSSYTYSLDGSNFQAGTNFTSLEAGTHSLIVQDANGCLFFTNDVVPQNNGPENSIANLTPANCTSNNGSIQIVNTSGGNPAYTYTLVGGGTQGSNTFGSLPSGAYTIIVSDQAGCTDTVFASIPNTSGFTESQTTITNPDCGDSNGEISVSMLTGNAPFQYSLNGGTMQSSNVFANLAAGTYTILVTDAGGCTFLISTIVVTENSPNLTPIVTISQSPNPACTGDNISFTASVTNGGASTNYEFFVNGVSVQNSGNAIYTSGALSQGDIIMCTVTSNDACIAINTDESNQINLTIFTPFTPTTTITSSDTDICEGDQVTITANSTDCNSAGSFDWMVNGVIISSTVTNTNTFSLSQNSQISVILNCTDACALPSNSNNVNINVVEIEANAGADQIIAPGESTILNGTGTSGGTFSWTPNSSLSNSNIASPTANPNSTTTYLLTVTANGCTATDEVTIVVSNLIIAPNTFTPNGDGTNETWQISRIEDYPNCEVNIYDRWGQKIYKSVGYSNSNPWDGTNNGLKLPASTYYYVIDLNTGSKSDVYNGSVTIVY